jgi:uncharacterized OB-fold protein
MHCRNCGQEIIEGSEFCGNCGARIEHRPVGLTCAKCGSLNLPEADFCSECGARLGDEAVPMQAFCPECGAAVKQSATFCSECGARLNVTVAPVQSFCPQCGELLNPNAAFCGNCGWTVEQGAEYTPATPEYAATEYRMPYQQQAQAQPQGQDYSQQQNWAQPQQQPQQQDWPPPQAQTQQQNWAPQPQAKPQPKGSAQHKMLMAAAAAVILLVIGITGFWKPGFLLDMFRPTAKLENGTLALKDIALDFKKTNLANGKATLTTVKDKEDEVQNGLIGDLYVMNVDKSCQGKVTVSLPTPKDFKPTTGNGRYIKLGIGRDYALADGKTARFYEYFDATVKDGKAVAVIDPAALWRSRRKGKTEVKPVQNAAGKKPADDKKTDKKTTDQDKEKFTEYVGFFFKNGLLQYGEGYDNSKGHFRLWYNYHVTGFGKNAYMSEGDAQKLLSDLEEAYNYYKTHGYAEHVDTYTPIDVYITRCQDEGGWQTLTGNMELKEASVFGANFDQPYDGSNRTNTKTTMYHEFFHAVQQSIIGTTDSALDSKKNNWFDEATATHFERVVVPGQVSDNERAQFWRLWQGPIPKESGTADGYARGLLIDFMSKKLGGDHWIKDCYDNWSEDYSWLKAYMKQIDPDEAGFAAKFYLEVAKGVLGPQSPGGYYNTAQHPSGVMGEDTYLSAIRLELDDKTKEKLAKGELGDEPIEFTSPTFEIEGYWGHIVALVTQTGKGNNVVSLTKDFPDGCQLSLAAPGCRVQVIRFQTGGSRNVESSDKSVINNFTEQMKKKYLYLALVTSTQPTKQRVALKATLELLKEGIYNGKATMTQGKKSYTVNNKVGFRLSQGKDGRWGLNICQANGDNIGSGPNVPLVYDAKQKIWKGHRKFKEERSKDPKKSRAEVSDINCTMKVNTKGKEPVLIVDYKVDITKLYVDYNYTGGGSFKVHFEGKWSSELKGRTIKTGKITILE